MQSDDDVTGIAIIGMAGRFPGADNVAELWRNLRAGIESVRPLSDAELSAAGVSPAELADPRLVKAMAMPAGIERFDAGFFGFSHREAEVMDPQQRLLLECAWEALEDAGYVGERFPGPTGVFAGTATSTYLIYQVLANPAILATLDPLHIDLGNSGDYLTTRISHKLDLTGPSFLIQCACSTSLVAVHSACQSLLAEECDMALAGGAYVNVGQLRGYVYEQGGIVSPDGHCRVFDARAGGSIVGSGLGMVVLRRLADALADGDSIRAVIRGSAINNDGARKVGYTAPSVEGQARVIAEALARGGVSPVDISYVEAHGTGTALGDPIEVEALTRAFNLDGRRRLCALGSVKTNLGHLSAAAGVAGLIKTVLSLEHCEIPPSLHFERANPEIDFERGPFYVNTELKEWPRNGSPRRAGVSAFGFGGTNAHVVLEEAPAAPPLMASPRAAQLLVLSARSAQALSTAAVNLAAHLRVHPELDLADVASTLHRGRKAFGHRRALVCRNREEAIALLSQPASEGVLTGAKEREDPGVVFLFPGLGDQHLHMASGLYASEPGFRADVDRSCELLAPMLGVDLRAVLYPEVPAQTEKLPGKESRPDLRRMLGRVEADGASRRLDRTLYAQPAVFVVEHALARLWMSWGVAPRAMIGYSLGEYTAACLAGVLSLPDALRLVAERARLVDELPAGAMLALPLPESELASFLGSDLSLAAVNAPEVSVVAGTEAAVAELEGELAGRGVVSRRLRTGHAFHSRQMEPAAERLIEVVRGLTLRPPRIPYLSNVTGAWITGREATDPEYWARHLCRPVRFAAGLGELLRGPHRLLLEVGPGQALGTAARQHPESAGAVVVPSLGERSGAEQATLLRAAGRLWIEGVEIDPEGFYRHERRRRVPLPTYPFERQRYWIEASPAAAPPQPIPVEEASTEPAAAEAAPAPVPSLSQHPRPALRNAYVAPRDETERTLAEIWQALLGVDEVGVHDDFFELGGHSFLATRLVVELRRSFGVELGMAALFERPTIAGFAAALAVERMLQKESAIPPEPLPQIVPDPANRHRPFPLTEVQQAYLLGRSDTFALGQVSTHFYAEVDAEDVDLARLTGAFRFIIERHDMLRAIVHLDGRQEILSSVPPYEVAALDLSGIPEAEAGAALESLRGRMSHQVRPSDRWPLFELRASLLSGGRVRLHFSFDFLVGDAWSLQVLLPEIRAAYHLRHAAIPPLSLSFRDYVLAVSAVEESPAFARALGYWTSRLADFPAAPELPLAANPAALMRPTFVRHAGRLAVEPWRRLKERGAQRGLTPSGVLLAAFAEVLTVWSKGPRFVVNLTLFNRLPLHPEVDALVGDFTSLTLLAVDNSRPAPFRERAQAIQRQLFEDLDHSVVSGVRVLREMARVQGGGAPAMMPIVFTSTLNQTPQGEILEGLGVEAALGYAVSQTPQVWLDHQVFEDPRGLSYSWDVVEELFPPGLVAEMFAAYQELLEKLSGWDEAWERFAPVGAPEGQLALYAAANATAGAVPEGLLHEPFLARALAEPERIAVVAGDLQWSYGEIARRANGLARRLRGMGAAPDRLVAIVMEKGWEQVVGVLAVSASGAAYLPIDPELPGERRCYLFENGGVEIALTQSQFLAQLEWPETVRPIAVSGERGEEDEGSLSAVQSPRDLAYVIYTSGSTGKPKGVMTDHLGALNTVVDLNDRFAIGPRDRVLALASLSFDLSVYDVFGMLAAGGAVVFPETGRSRDPEHWAELVERHEVTLWNTVPALMEMLVDFSEVSKRRLGASLRLVWMSGDWIPLSLPDRIRQLAERIEVISMGGATEASIWSILYAIGEVEPDWHSVPYGKAMRNQRFHVLDGALAPRPVWVPGYLHIGGIGLARGYWADPAKTATSFVAAPGEEGGERLYRTGDLGRYLPDGNIEFLGREDFQVKVGGFRIELGEIETALARHPSVREALVAAQAGAQPGSKRLIAYLVPAPGASPAAGELRSFLGERLPAYMVPADFVVLDAFPLTGNGKIDRRALPAPRPSVAAEPAALAGERSPVEELVAGFLREVLQVERLGPDDNFFELGGNSLLAVQVTSRLRACFGIELSLRALFEQPTLGALARRIERERAAADGLATAPPLGPRRPEDFPAGLPLSFAQQRLWFLDRLQPGSAQYDILQAARIAGRLDARVLTACLAEIERRHEALRSVFTTRADGTPVQVVQPPGGAVLPRVDLSGLGGRAEALALGPGGLFAAESRRPFDLARGPLWRGLLLMLGAAEHLLLLSVHHIVADGWSMGILLGEIQELYRAFAAGLPSPLPELPVQYADFAAWQQGWLQGEALERQLAYWKRRLGGAPELLELPADRPRPAVQTSAGAIHAFVLPAELVRDVQALARASGVTPFMVFLAGFEALLGRYTGREDAVVGTPVAGRNHLLTERLIGFFVNTLALRVDLAGDPGFSELLSRVREVALGAFAHQDLPFEKLVSELDLERHLSHAPLCQVVFALQNAPFGAHELPDLTLTPLPIDNGTAKFDLAATLAPLAADAGGGLAGALEYNRDLFDGATMRRLARHLETLLAGAAAEPGRRLSELPLLTAPEWVQIVREWNDTAADHQRTPLVHELVSLRARRVPAALAIASPVSRLTYGEVEALSNRLAHHLRGLGVGPESLVAVCMERTPERVVAILAVAKAGGAYVSLDPTYPRERLAFVLADARAPVLLTERRFADRLPETAAAVICLDEGGDWMGGDDLAPPTSGVGPENLAYVVYTSGSTGRPKGVAIPHAGLANLVRWYQERFGLVPGDRGTQIASPAFDASAVELWPFLAGGGELHVPDEETRLSAPGMMRWWSEVGITLAYLMTPLAEAVLEELAERASSGPLAVRAVFTGGDRLHRRPGPGVGFRLWNTYGPAEYTVTTSAVAVASAAPASRPADLPSIGRALPNTRIYVLDRALQPLPAGVPGELCVAGAGLARGYVGRPELTSERFVPDPWAPEPGARMYRTADLVRWRTDGDLDFLGRLDHQVKVRGFRIELGEIEAALAEHPAVREAAVVVREDRPGDRRLAAYVVPVEAAALSAAELRAFLLERLPGYMVPAGWAVLAELPLNANGKLDRAALPAPETGRREGYVEPRGAVEAALAAIWEEVLGRERIGVEDDFFAAGGHSLLATQVTSRVRRALGVELPLRTLFERPTVAALAVEIERLPREAELAGRSPVEPPPLARRERAAGGLPLSFAQQRLWFLDRLQPGSAQYNVLQAARMTGRLAVGTLRRCLAEIERRHESLRTVFAAGDDGTPAQIVQAPAGGAPLPQVDLSGVGPRAEALALGAGGLLAAEAARPFDLARGPLWRGLLVRLGDEHHLLLLDLHHIVSDGWSVGILMAELQALYGAFSAGLPSPLPELPLQYADFAAWQREWLRGEVLERQLAYWRGRLAGAPELLELPSDRPRPALQTSAGAVHAFALPAALAREVQALSQASGTTPFMVLLAAFQALLGRYTGREDLVVGTPVAGRNRVETERLIGFFVNTLAIRADLGGDPSFAGLLSRVRESALAGFDHQDLPFEKLVSELDLERHLSHAPLCQVLFALQNAPFAAIEVPGLRLTPLAFDNGTTKLDLAATLTPMAADAGGGLAGNLEYNRDLFDGATMRRLARHFEALLAGAVLDAERRLSELPLLTAPERAQVVREWHDTASPHPPAPLVHELVSLHARRRPGATAVASPASRLTYGEVEALSNRLAHHLRDLGVGPESLVALCMERTPERVVGILAVAKAGGAYVSLDPAYPRERLAFVLADAGAPVLLTERRFVAALPETRAAVICLDEGWDWMSGDGLAPPASGVGPENLAYVVYTSGSTGKPKGVEIPHAGLSNLVRWYQERFGLVPGDRGTQIASPAFDASAVELWPFLAGGGELHVPDEETRLSASGMVRWWSEAGITLAYLMTPLAEGVLEELAEDTSPRRALSVRSLFTGGDRLHRRPGPGVGFRLWNTYGPAEYAVTTSAVAVAPAATEPDLPSIGRALPNTRIYVLDRALQPLPAGVPGELCAAGAGLARGYLRRPELTAERFVPDPWGPEPGARMYRTADLVRWRTDGDLDFLGRLDHQVKLRGFRIEPGEIEAALAEHPGVREAAVVVREDRPGDRRLAAYVVPADAAAPEPEELRAFLMERLPGYMVPADWVSLEALPQSANGKLDRAALPAPEVRRREVHAAPRGPVEELVASIWEEVLGRERVGADDDFFALGGHSLLATQVTSRVRRALGVELPLRALFERPTVAALAAEIERLRHAGAARVPPLAPAPRQGDLPLSFAQEQIWFIEQLEGEGSVFVMAFALRLRGALAVAALAAALREVARRHEVLRARFVAAAGKPAQRFDPAWRPGLPVLDLAGLPAAAASGELARLAAAEERRPFDLARGPLLRSTLVRLGAEESVLLLTLHHIVSDGWSMGILVRELGALYAAAVLGRPSPLPEPPIQYADFAVWQRRRLSGEALDGELRSAADRLAGLPALALPADRPPAAATGRLFRAGSVPIALAAPLSEGLRALARRQGASLFMTLLAAFEVFLHRHTGQDDFAVGAPIATRGRAELETLVGFFLNTLVLRAETGGDPPFVELLARVRAKTLEAYEHQDLPFARLVETLRPDRQRSTPLIDASFLLQNQPMPPLALPGVEVEVVRRPLTDARTNFALSLDLAEADGLLVGLLGYDSTIFDAATGARWTRHLLTLLAGAVADPERPLSELPLLDPGERHQVAVEWGAGGEAVLLGCNPAPIGVWGELWREGADGVRALTGRRARRRADGALEAWRPVPEAASRAAEPAAASGVLASVAKRLTEQEERLQKLSPAKRRLLEKRFRGEATAGGNAARAVAPAEPSPRLVELQRGAPGRPPFFCVHAIGGTVLSYAELARCLGPAQPFYGIQAAGLAGGDAVDDLLAMAADYAAAVEAAAPESPCLLGGWSSGGVVAFEMARQLQARRREVALVALLDSWAPMPSPAPQAVAEAEVLRLFLRDQASLAAVRAPWLDEELPADEAAALRSLLDRAHETGLLKASLRPDQVRPLLGVYRANLRAIDAYRPETYAGRLTLFRPQRAMDPTNGWDGLAAEPIEVHELAADHYALLSPPAVATLAERLASAIARALGAAGWSAPGEPQVAVPPPLPAGGT